MEPQTAAEHLKQRFSSLLTRKSEKLVKKKSARNWHVHAEVIEPRRRAGNSPKGKRLTPHRGLMAEIGIKALYAGRDTFRTDRLWAGGYVVDREYRFQVQDLSFTRSDGGSGKPIETLTEAQVFEALRQEKRIKPALRVMTTRGHKKVTKRQWRDCAEETNDGRFYRNVLAKDLWARTRSEVGL